MDQTNLVKRLGGRFIKAIPDVVVYLGIAVLLLDDAIHATLQTASRFIPLEARVSLIAAVLGGLVWWLSRFFKQVNTMLDALRGSTSKSIGVLNSWEDIDLPRRYKSAKFVEILNLAGTQFAKLGMQESLQSLFHMEKNKDIRILIGNPRAAGVRLRYERGQGEPVTYETGLEGIERRLLELYRRWKKLPAKLQRKFQVRVFSQYPTVSLVRLDNDYFSATYGYEMRGGDCPKLHAVAGGIYSEFLERHFANTFNEALPLKEWIRKYYAKDL